MKTKTLKSHMIKIAPLGAKATFKKFGRAHYVKMAKVRWAKRNAKNKK